MNRKKFNIYIFISSFARNLIEVFIPLILYRFGFTLKEIMLYYLMVNFFSFVIGYGFLKCISYKRYKMLSIIGIISFAILQVVLNRLVLNIYCLILIAILFAIYRRGYWIPRRFYNLNIIPEKNISLIYTIVSIVNQCAVIFSTYIGAIFLDYFNIKLLTILSIVLFFISIIPLYFFKLEDTGKTEKIQLMKTLKQIPFSKIYLFGSYELTNIIKFLMPLYLYIYVENNYKIVGILNVIANVSLIIFSYLYGKKINGKKNYLKMSVLLVVLIYILKINITNSFLIIVCLIEGIVTKMQEISVNKEFYILSKKFDYANYNCAYECIQNFFRTIVTLILFAFGNDVKNMIYATLLFLLLNIFLKFKTVEEINS